MSRFMHATKVATNVVEKSLVVPPLFERVVGNFPEKIQMAFAYGSGVYHQEGDPNMSKNMLDFIFVVDDPFQWHQRNLAVNSKHYSFLKHLGPWYVSRIQDRYGAGIYFNTLVPFEDRLIKYGVIGRERLIADLLDWDSLYVSGRLHKPIRLIVLPDSQRIVSALYLNLQNAVHAALLMLPEKFTEEDLYTCISGLSYHGDFRMTFGEDKNKVKNIVKPSVKHFRKLYEEILDSVEHIHWNKSQGVFEQYPNHISQFHHLNLLPKTVQLNLLMASQRKLGQHPHLDMEQVIRNLALDSRCSEFVTKSVAQIVQRSSWSQSIKTVFTAGVFKSVWYSMKKVKKMFKR